jgi:hypothetical protein
VELHTHRFVHTQRLQFRNEALGKISPKSPEVTHPRSTEKQTRSGLSASGLVNKQQPRVGIVGEQRLDVNGHQLLIREHVFSPFTTYVIGLDIMTSDGGKLPPSSRRVSFRNISGI